MGQVVKVTIDGRPVEVPEGTLIVEAAKRVGVDIPVFCYHPRMKPYGACRQCLTEVERMPKLQIACATPVAEGMVIHTNTDRVLTARKAMLEFTLINHPLDCPICDKGGECDLQDLTFAHAAKLSRFREQKIHREKAVPLGPLVMLDQERCILCQRCIRFQDEVAGDPVLVLKNRGSHEVVDTVEGRVFDDRFSGNTIEMCPVGALTSRPYRFVARPWDLKVAASVCQHCPVGCNTRVSVRAGDVLRLLSRDNDAVDRGWLCDRGRFGYGFVRADERIVAPEADGQRVSWARALEAVDAALRGRGADAAVLGGASLTLEGQYLAARYARDVIGTPHVDHRLGGQRVLAPSSPGVIRDVDDADVVVLMETDPWEAFPVAGLRLRKAAVDRGVPVFSLNATPRGIPVPTLVPLGYRPGGLARVVMALVASLRHEAVEPWLEGTGIDAPALEPLARRLSEPGKALVFWDGRDASAGAIDALVAARGSAVTRVIVPGDEAASRGADVMGLRPDLDTGYRPVERAGMDARGILEAAADGRIDTLLVLGADLFHEFPDPELVERALARCDRVVALSVMRHETARRAHLLLPLAPWLESDGAVMNMEGRVQVIQAATDPADEAVADWAVLARMLGIEVHRARDVRRRIAQAIAELSGDLGGEGRVVGLVPPPAPAAEIAPMPPRPQGGLELLTGRLLEARGIGPEPYLAAVASTLEVRMHPADMAQRGLADGQPVELVAGERRLEATVRPGVGLAEGCAWVGDGARGRRLGSGFGPGVRVEVSALEVLAAGGAR